MSTRSHAAVCLALLAHYAMSTLTNAVSHLFFSLQHKYVCTSLRRLSLLVCSLLVSHLYDLVACSAGFYCPAGTASHLFCPAGNTLLQRLIHFESVLIHGCFPALGYTCPAGSS